MKVHLIKKQTVEDYAYDNVQSRSAFELWLSILKHADWNKPNNILSTFSSNDILGKSSDRVVFNIGGKNYRVICKYKFGHKNVHLFIKWIGTHTEYTELCDDNNQFKIEMF